MSPEKVTNLPKKRNDLLLMGQVKANQKPKQMTSKRTNLWMAIVAIAGIFVLAFYGRIGKQVETKSTMQSSAALEAK
jgi:hypothetical protein